MNPLLAVLLAVLVAVLHGMWWSRRERLKAYKRAEEIFREEVRRSLTEVTIFKLR